MNGMKKILKVSRTGIPILNEMADSTEGAWATQIRSKTALRLI